MKSSTSGSSTTPTTFSHVGKFKGNQPKPVARRVHPSNPIVNERMQYFFLSLIGQVVTVSVTPHGRGTYEGLFYAYRRNKSTEEGGFTIVLRCVRPRTSNKWKDFESDQKLIDVFEVSSRDILQIVAKDIMFATENRQFREETFRIDTQISGDAQMMEGRELIRWEGDSRFDPMSPNFIGELNASASNEPFDMYKANAKFGIQSTYDESLYTTRLDKSNEALVQKAAQLAKEIESDAYLVDNIHVREDRGLADETEISEENRYSTVLRDDEESKPSTASQATHATPSAPSTQMKSKPSHANASHAPSQAHKNAQGKRSNATGTTKGAKPTPKKPARAESRPGAPRVEGRSEHRSEPRSNTYVAPHQRKNTSLDASQRLNDSHHHHEKSQTGSAPSPHAFVPPTGVPSHAGIEASLTPQEALPHHSHMGRPPMPVSFPSPTMTMSPGTHPTSTSYMTPPINTKEEQSARSDERKKLNPNAKAFNPNAKPFTSAMPPTFPFYPIMPPFLMQPPIPMMPPMGPTVPIPGASVPSSSNVMDPHHDKRTVLHPNGA